MEKHISKVKHYAQYNSLLIKKAECLRIDAFELWCCRRLLRVPWTARRSNQSILPLVAQSVKSLPAMQETQVQSLGWKDPLEKEMATHSVFLPGEFHGQRSLAGYIVHGVARVRHDWVTDTTARAQCLGGLDSVHLWVSYFCPGPYSFIQRIFIGHLFTRHSHALGYICNASYMFCI